MSIRQNGNKLILIICIVLLATILTGCPAIDDWNFDDLPNQYVIMKINCGDVQFGKLEEQGYVKRIDRYVVAFCYNGRYIGIQRIPVDSSYNEVIKYEDLDCTKVEYYLIDSETDVISGPWFLEKFNSELQLQEISNMCEWFTTELKPDGAH